MTAEELEGMTYAELEALTDDQAKEAWELIRSNQAELQFTGFSIVAMKARECGCIGK